MKNALDPDLERQMFDKVLFIATGFYLKLEIGIQVAV